MRVMCKEDDAVEPEIIKISHLSKSFGDVKAVNDLSFQVKKGELFAFLGENGAGKSTTILVNGLALILCLCYMYKMGWYLSAADVLWIMGDEILIVLLAAHFPALSAFR
mgnify:FL=1